MKKIITLQLIIPFAIYTYLGWWIGSKLIDIPNFQTFKVLNVIGLTYDLLGVCVLSQFITSNEKYRLMLGNAAEHFCILIVSSGIGIILSGQFGHDGPSRSRLEDYSISAFMFFVVPNFVYMSNVVIGIDRKPPWSDETRNKLFGGFFLLGGILIQIYAALLDLYN